VGLVEVMHALHVPTGSEVLTSALNFPPLIERMRAHWRPVPVDVDGTSACVEGLARALGPGAGALIATHAFGRPAPMAAYRQLADRHGVPLIEDAAQALGAKTEARGDAAVISFGPTKPLAAWGGGAVLCRERAVADRVRARGRRYGGGRASRIARGLAFELVSRFGGPVAKRASADELVERWLTDPAGEPRRRPWQDAPMGALEARLVRMRLAGLGRRTEARRSQHRSVSAELASRGLDVWPDVAGGIGFGVLMSSDDAPADARALRRRGIDAPHGELRLIGDPRVSPKAARLERTLLRVPVAW